MTYETKKHQLPLNIQFFSEEPPADPPSDPADPPAEPETFTRSEVDSQISKAVKNAIEKKQAEWQAQLDEKLAAERKSGEEYAKMTAKEKEDAEYKKRLSALEKREQELNTKQLHSQIESDLKEKSLPVSFASSLVSVGDNEQIKEAISGIKKDFDDAVNAAVKEKLRQDTPPSGGNIRDNKKGPSVAEMARKARIIKN